MSQIAVSIVLYPERQVQPAIFLFFLYPKTLRPNITFNLTKQKISQKLTKKGKKRKKEEKREKEEKRGKKEKSTTFPSQSWKKTQKSRGNLPEGAPAGCPEAANFPILYYIIGEIVRFSKKNVVFIYHTPRTHPPLSNKQHFTFQN